MAHYWQRTYKRLARSLNLDTTHAQRRYASELDSLVAPGERWLEIGCGKQVLAEWVMSLDRQRKLASRASLLVGADLDPAIARHPLLSGKTMAAGESLPFATASFSLITANTVVEHLEDPERFLLEAFRVLKEGGRLLFHTPNYAFFTVFLASITPEWIKRKIIALLEHRTEEDIFPTHYRMNTPQTIRRIAGACGMQIEKIQMAGSGGTFVALGPIGWLECLLLKALSVLTKDRYRSNLIVVLRKPGTSRIDREAPPAAARVHQPLSVPAPERAAA